MQTWPAVYRLMCGKALPYRAALFKDPARGSASERRRSLPEQGRADRKARGFRHIRRQSRELFLARLHFRDNPLRVVRAAFFGVSCWRQFADPTQRHYEKHCPSRSLAEHLCRHAVIGSAIARYSDRSRNFSAGKHLQGPARRAGAFASRRENFCILRSSAALAGLHRN